MKGEKLVVFNSRNSLITTGVVVYQLRLEEVWTHPMERLKNDEPCSDCPDIALSDRN